MPRFRRQFNTYMHTRPPKVGLLIKCYVCYAMTSAKNLDFRQLMSRPLYFDLCVTGVVEIGEETLYAEPRPFGLKRTRNVD